MRFSWGTNTKGSRLFFFPVLLCLSFSVRLLRHARCLLSCMDSLRGNFFLHVRLTQQEGEENLTYTKGKSLWWTLTQRSEQRKKVSVYQSCPHLRRRVPRLSTLVRTEPDVATDKKRTVKIAWGPIGGFVKMLNRRPFFDGKWEE